MATDPIVHDNSIVEHPPVGSEHSSVWRFPFGYKAPSRQVVFFVQVTVALIVILTAIINLTIPNFTGEEEKNYWKIALSGTIGYLFPSPKLTTISSGKRDYD
jgi:hypothetical protein